MDLENIIKIFSIVVVFFCIFTMVVVIWDWIFEK